MPIAIPAQVFFIFTCEYCLSHYVTAALLILTGYKLLFDDWRGYLIAGFSMVWIANLYMSFFGRVRLEIKRERIELSSEEKEANSEPLMTGRRRRSA